VWTEEFEDYRAHILDSSYNDRFYILMKAFVFKKNGRLTEIKPIERFNDYQLKIFEAQVKSYLRTLIFGTLFLRIDQLIISKRFLKL